MAHQERLQLPNRFYFIRELFQPNIEMLVPARNIPHSADDLSLVETRRAHYEAQLAYSAYRWHVRIHAHCWLADSALLLVQTRYAPLEWFMRSLRGPFSHYLVTAMGIRKPYVGRYQVLLADEQEFFLDIARYILCAPHATGLCKNPSDYDHSSAAACLRSPVPPFLAKSDLLTATHGLSAPNRLAAFIAGKPKPGFRWLIEHGSRIDRRVLGRADFVRQVQREAARPRIDAPAIICIEWVARRLAINSADILSKPRSYRAVEARALVGWLASCSGAAHISTVARWFNTDRSSLERAIDHRLHAIPQIFSDNILSEFYAFLTQIDLHGEQTVSLNPADR